jgi:hypothetical protein
VCVLDGVFSASTAAQLRDVLVAADACVSSAAEETRVIDRWAPDAAEGPVERALLSFLDQREARDGGGSGAGRPAERFVEWWWRDEWLDFEAHRDVSEREAARSAEHDRRLRCPSWAHVLYLAADARVRGPTCVWEQDEDTSISAGKGSSANAGGAVSDASMKAAVARVSVVPAVAGRVLRFRGDMLHSVPRPGLRYLLTDEFAEGEEDGDDEGASYEDDEDDDEDDDENFESIERAVILFNTWAEPPLDEIGGKSKVGTDWSLDIDVDGAANEAAEEDAPPTEESSMVDADLRCEPQHLWVKTTVTETHWENTDASASLEEHRVVLGVPLLGDRFRRGRAANALVVLAQRAAAEAAMLSEAQPYRLPLMEVQGE